MFSFRRLVPAIALTILTATVGATLGSAPASAAAQLAAPTAIAMRSAPGMCLDVPLDKIGDNKQPVQIYYCNGGTNQQWEFVPGAYFGFGQLKNVRSQKCLDVQGAAIADGAAIQQYTCMDVPNQQWSYSPFEGLLIAMHSGKCPGVASSQYKTKAYQANCGGSLSYPHTLWNASI